jgi:hypothetical protein
MQRAFRWMFSMLVSLMAMLRGVIVRSGGWL